MILAEDAPDQTVRTQLGNIQHDLFDLGGELCVPGQCVIDQSFVQRLERELDDMNAELPPLKEFILPGGGRAAAACHLARTVCRRAERRLWSLARHEAVNPATPHYLNRLSDYLFVLARVLARCESGQEVLWNRSRVGS